VERFYRACVGLGFTPRIVEFPVSTRTSAEAATAIGTEVACIVKSLVFLADGEPVLVLASGVNRVDLERLKRVLGARVVSKADATAVRAATGYAIGGVPPICRDGERGQPRTLLDRDLLRYPEIWAAAGAPNAVFPTTAADLQRLTGAEVVEVAEG